MNAGSSELSEYNSFCRELKAGNVLYNLNSTNMWGEYLLVVNVAAVKVGESRTYTVMLLELRRQDGKFVPGNTCVSMTPDYADNIPFLRYVGHCKFSLVPLLEDVNINIGLATVYGNTDLHKFTTKLSIRKPRSSKYDKEGNPVIRKPRN